VAAVWAIGEILLHLPRPFLVKWTLSLQMRIKSFLDSNEATRRNLFGDYVDDVNFNHKVQVMSEIWLGVQIAVAEQLLILWGPIRSLQDAALVKRGFQNPLV
jgi:hypothetical protein